MHMSLRQGCGVGVETGVRVDRSRPFWLESEKEMKSVKLFRLRIRPVVADYHPSIDDDFGRTAIHPPENIGRQKEKESGSMYVHTQIKLKRHLLIEIRLIKANEDNFRVIAIVA